MIMYRKPLCLVILVALGLAAIPQAIHAQVENLILNHSFEDDEDFQGGDQWRTWADVDGQDSTVAVAETEAVDGVRSLRVDPIGTFYVVYSPLSLEIDTEYTLSFWAMAEEPRPLGITPKASDNSVSAGGTNIELTAEWTEYTVTFDAPATVLKLDVFCGGSDVRFYLDFFHIYEGPYISGIEPSGKQLQVMAVNPDPAGGQDDVPYDTDLSWTPGVFAATHDVYFGTVRDDVNDASRDNPLDVLVSKGQTATTYDPPGLLELSQTYYWRVDEVNAAPDGTILKGGVWSFTAERGNTRTHTEPGS
jgi:carbohydrate binding protein with CBM4/9 domain